MKKIIQSIAVVVCVGLVYPLSSFAAPFVVVQSVNAKKLTGPSVSLSLSRAGETSIPVVVKTAGHTPTTLTALLLDKTGKSTIVLASVSKAVTKPGSYTLQMKPITSFGSSVNSSKYIVRVTMAPPKGPALVMVNTATSIVWEGAAAPTGKQLIAYIAEVGDVGIPKPESRKEPIEITLDRVNSVKFAYRQNVEGLTYTVYFQRKTSSGYTTIFKTTGGASGKDLQRTFLEFQLNGKAPDENTVSDGEYRLVMDSINAADTKKQAVRDSITFKVDWQHKNYCWNWTERKYYLCEKQPAS